jgi:hypothetical protein
MLSKFKKLLFKNIFIVSLLVLGTLSWSLTLVKSGLIYPFGMGFWGPNGHDGIWHLALINSLAKGSFQMPIFAGEAVKNYHIGFDFLISVLSRLTGIIPIKLYFQILPPILALFIGYLCYRFVYSWKKSKSAALWSTFFVYFGGGFGWVVTLLGAGKLGGESLFWSQQSISTLINPPFALSILVIFLGLNLLIEGLQSKNTKKLLLTAILFGVLAQIKVYANILCLAGLFFAGVCELTKKKDGNLLKIFLGSTVISVLLIYPVVVNARQTLVFKPFWFLESMMANMDRLYWPRFAEAMVNYRLGSVWLKAIVAYFVAFLIFWYGNFGTRFLSEIYIAKKIRHTKKISWLEVFIFSIIFVGAFFPLFFIQAGNSWNTIQFMYYSLIFSGVLSGVFLAETLEKVSLKNKHNMYDILIYHTWRWVLPLVAIGLTIPTTLGTLWFNYLPSRPPAKISNEELEALNFLKNQPDGVVLTIPFDRKLADAAVNNPPRPLYLYESTAYVSAFSRKAVFLEDEVNLQITGYDWQERREEVENFLKTNNPGVAQQFLKENNIKYLYWPKSMLGEVSEDQDVVSEIFENQQVQILKVE